MRRRVRGTSVALCLGALALWAPRLSAVAAPVAVPVVTSGAPEWVWWEAEAARNSNFPANPFDPATPKATAALSAGKWIGAEHLKQPLFAEYDVVVRKSGSYDFYARKFWRHGPFRWRFDGEDWRRSGPDLALLDDVSLAKFVNANWVRLGAVKLTAGRHVFRVEVEAGANAVAFDCFLLIDGPFVPRGKLKPGEKSGTAPPGWFAFEPDADPFAASPLDLRWLNERTAGEGGFIQAKGDSFVHEKTGRPIRLWGVDIDPDVLQQDAVGLDRFARRLAKSGVNLVRVHEPFWRDDDLGRVDDAKLNSLQRFVAALKRQGIYLSLSTYYPAWLRPNGQPGFEGYDGRLNPFGAAFFNPSPAAAPEGMVAGHSHGQEPIHRV